MSRWAVPWCLWMSLGVVAGQTAERALPQWLTGIIAVSGFLFMVFLVFLINKAWCEDPGKGLNEEESVAGGVFTKTNGNSYDITVDPPIRNGAEHCHDNLGLETEEERIAVTAM